ncbi:hypothetical protein ACN47E_001455 [Coniothyrium glycines]
MFSKKAIRVSKDKALSFDTANYITVIVGKEPRDQQRFILNESIICARSEFFRRAMNGNWIEKDERIIKMPEDDAITFSNYVNLIYMGRLPTMPLEERHTSLTIAAEFKALAELYVLAERLCDHVTKNTVVDLFMAVLEQKTLDQQTYAPPIKAITTLYAGTSRGSLGRRLLADMWTAIPPEFRLEHQGELPQDFIVDVLIALRKDRSDTKQSVACFNMKNKKEEYFEKVEELTSNDKGDWHT